MKRGRPRITKERGHQVTFYLMPKDHKKLKQLKAKGKIDSISAFIRLSLEKAEEILDNQ